MIDYDKEDSMLITVLKGMILFLTISVYILIAINKTKLIIKHHTKKVGFQK